VLEHGHHSHPVHVLTQAERLRDLAGTACGVDDVRGPDGTRMPVVVVADSGDPVVLAQQFQDIRGFQQGGP
jgi:hypothetical protein